MMKGLKLCFIICFALSLKGYNQNLGNIGQGKAFGLSGGINASNVFYHAQGIDARRNPNNYFLSGNLNLSIYDWSVPVSFSYSDQNRSFQQPFNQYGISPTYKWITLDAGYRSKNFSSYTVGGHLFLGGGFDLDPTETFKVSAFYGRLNKAVEEDTSTQNNLPAYERMGGGIKISAGGQKNNISLILFKASDRPGSLQLAPVKTIVTPQDNFVSGLEYNFTLAKRLILKGEVASSAITSDARAEEIVSGSAYNKVPFLFRARISSSYYHAYKTSVQYAMKSMAFGLAHERVDPGYRTLGAYYFNNDLETFSVTTGAVAFDKKAKIDLQAGIQRNNPDKDELNTMNRLSAAVTIGYQVSRRMMYNFSFSNFQTVMNFRSRFDQINQTSPFETLDTLNFRQLSQNGSMNANFVLNENKDRRQNLSVSFAYQRTSDSQADIDQPSGSVFYNISSSYNIVLAPQDLTAGIAANGNLSRSLNSESRIYGPTLSVRKTFFEKKLSVTANCSYNQSYRENILVSRVINLRTSCSWMFREKHQFDFNAGRIIRQGQQNENIQTFREITIQVSYGYNFAI